MNKINIILILFIFNSSACAESKIISIENKTVKLNSQECILELEENSIIRLNLTKNCYFVKYNNSGKTKVAFIDDIKSHVVIIVGATVSNYPGFPITNGKKDCGTELQALILNKDRVFKLSKLVTGSVTCASVGVDDKEYWIISH